MKTTREATTHAARVLAAQPEAAAQFSPKEQATLRNYLAKTFDRAVPPIFVGVRKTVMQGDKCVGVMCSKTMAKRTANALNRHKPNREGV